MSLTPKLLIHKPYETSNNTQTNSLQRKPLEDQQ